jgi:hypothetical protein
VEAVPREGPVVVAMPSPSRGYSGLAVLAAAAAVAVAGTDAWTPAAPIVTGSGIVAVKFVVFVAVVAVVAGPC